jgi:peptide/nickel transport system permease protein
MGEGVRVPVRSSNLVETRSRREHERRHPFARFIGRRFVAFAALVFGITIVAFLLVRVVPANPAYAALGAEGASNPAAVRAFDEQYGLDKPLPVQYLTYLDKLVHGNLGVSSRTGDPVSQDLEAAIPATMELAVVAIIISVVGGVVLGVLAGVKRGRWIDQVIRVATLCGVSVPSFWLATLAYYILFFRLGVAPSGGELSPIMSPPPDITGSYVIDALLDGNLTVAGAALAHLWMPALVMSFAPLSFITRFTRSAVLEVLESDYVQVARSKGLPERVVVSRYVVRAALVSIVTVVGLSFGALLTGAVLTEEIFSWPGVGQYAYLSATNLDTNAIVGVCLFFGVVYVTVNFLVDIAYGFIDPRIRVSGG